MKNFTRPEGEEPYYYASTVEDGVVVKHDGDIEHAVYESEMREISRRANLWHNWVAKKYPHAYDGMGIMNPSIYSNQSKVRQQFMGGERV